MQYNNLKRLARRLCAKFKYLVWRRDFRHSWKKRVASYEFCCFKTFFFFYLRFFLVRYVHANFLCDCSSWRLWLCIQIWFRVSDLGIVCMYLIFFPFGISLQAYSTSLTTCKKQDLLHYVPPLHWFILHIWKLLFF